MPDKLLEKETHRSPRRKAMRACQPRGLGEILGFSLGLLRKAVRDIKSFIKLLICRKKVVKRFLYVPLYSAVFLFFYHIAKDDHEILLCDWGCFVLFAPDWRK